MASFRQAARLRYAAAGDHDFRDFPNEILAVRRPTPLVVPVITVTLPSSRPIPFSFLTRLDSNIPGLPEQRKPRVGVPQRVGAECHFTWIAPGRRVRFSRARTVYCVGLLAGTVFRSVSGPVLD